MARTLRLILLIAALLVVVWSFGEVGARQWHNWRATHDRPVTLTILHWGDPAENVIVQKLVTRFEEQNPTVRIVDISTSDFDSKLKTMMAAGTPPDLFYLRPEALPQFAPLKLIRPIDDYLNAEFAQHGRAWFDDYFPSLISGYRYDVATQSVGKGPLYGLPKDFTTLVMYANVDLCKQAGIDLPKIQRDGWTWAEYEDACRKIKALSDTTEFKRAGRVTYGGVFEIWPDTLRAILWSFGGEFFHHRPDGSADFRSVALDDPASQRALQMIRRTRIDERTVYNNTGVGKDGAQEFVNGNIGFDGPVGRWKVPRFTQDMTFTWDVVPMPYETPQTRDQQIIMTAWTMSTGCKHPDEAYRLMKFLSGPEGATMQSELGLAIPPLQSVANSPAFLSPPGLPTHHAQVFLDEIARARIQQMPREAEWNRIVNDTITESIQLKEQTTLESAQAIEKAWLAELDSPLKTSEYPPMRWDVVGGIAATVIVALIGLFVWSARREKLGALDRTQQRTGYLFILPWLLGFLALTAGPMVVSLLLSFTKWSAMTPMTDAQSVGVENYRQLIFHDPTFPQSLKVTGTFMLLSVPISQIAALLIALLMNLRLRGITVFRTLYFVPSVVGLVAMSMLALQVFNNDYGILNQILRIPPHWWLWSLALILVLGGVGLLFNALGRMARRAAMLAVAMLAAGLIAFVAGALCEYIRIAGPTPPDWFGADARRWAIPGFVIIGLWGVGGGMIIYLAGLKGIPTSLYEAATIDGAGPVRRLWNVTLPQLSPLIFYNLVMGIIGSFQVFTQAYIMTGAGPGNATLFYVLQLYRQAFEFHNMGYASAIAWVLFVICLAVTLLVFRGSRDLVYYEGLK